MKRNFKYTGIILVLIATMLLNACKENIDPVIDQLDFDRAFTPFEFAAQITNVTTVTLSWKTAKNIDHYVVEIYEGTVFVPASMIYSTEPEANETSLEYLLPAGDTQFSARIKAVSALEGVSDSKWANIEFKSGPENLFTGYQGVLTGIGQATFKWTGGKEVTKLLFVKGQNELSFDITAGELNAGTKDVNGVPNGLYEIRLMNGDFVRGRQNFLFEGDVLLESGDDLTAAMDAISPGGVILLRNGENFGFTGNYTLTKSLKIRGLLPENLPKIYPTSGERYFILNSALTINDSLVFENIHLSGLINLDPLTKTRGVLDQENTAAYVCAIGTLKFKNCNIFNMGRHILRLRGVAGNQIINNIVIDNCIIFDAAFGAGNNYALIHSSAATAIINNILMKNSTIYHTRHSIILYTAGPSCNGIEITNCTFDDVARDSLATRYIMDLNTTTFNTGAGISIKNSILGSTPFPSSGVRYTSGTLSVTGTYYTSDYDDGATTSIKTLMTPYSGASTGLWTNPVAGIFTFLDAGFAGKETAGDPRWK